MPERWGRAAWFVVSVCISLLTVQRLGARRPAIIAYLLSPPVLLSLLNANVECLPVLGFTLSPALGLLLVSMKPQSGLVVIVFWLVEAWRVGRLRAVVRVFAPVTALALASFALWGL